MSEHGGNIRQLAQKAGINEEDVLDFSANINPLGPPSWLRSVISRNVEELIHYPDPDCTELVKTISTMWRIPPEQVVVGNGENELIFTIPRALEIKRAIICPPAYIDYEKAARQCDAEIVHVPLQEFQVDWTQLKKISRPDDLLFLGHPNNPTGRLLDKEKVLDFLKSCPETTVFIDEAFIDFAGEEHSFIHHINERLIIGRSFTKFYAIPGLRLGCVLACPATIQKIKDQMFAWSVNTLAQKVGVHALNDREFQRESLKTLAQNKKTILAELQTIPQLEIFETSVNYLLCSVSDRSGTELTREMLLKQHIAIRDCANYDNLGDSYFRIAIKSKEENEKLCRALKACLLNQKPSKKRTKKKSSLMIQGTSSNSGKSILTAAFCRIFLQDGLRICPFKSQNMSLNSYVTHDGFEIARAQVVQAQAAKLDPDIRMNPVLLKPNAEKGTQIIINGRVVDNMSWKEYIQYKPTAFKEVTKCYDSLSDEFDAVILEGAGSPAEVNLKQDDIVNMGMARYARCPVLLTGDIDRGGTYASFVGTTEVLLPWERNLISGFLVNRFRGDSSLLQEAHDFVELHTRKPVFGVIPYLPKLGLPEEDSVSFKERVNPINNNAIDIALIDLPKISNISDFDAFDIEDDVNLRIVRDAHELGNPDCIILPGTKATVSDLHYLKNSGLAQGILQQAEKKCIIVGICGGFQMLGHTIFDPHSVESDSLKTTGLNLLDISTEMARQKSLSQVKLPGNVQGYEIHHGQTSVGNSQIIMKSSAKVLGVQNHHGNIWGTYLHGIFDNDQYRLNFLNGIRKKKNLETKTNATVYDLEPAFDRLADAVRNNVNMNKIYQLMGL